MYVHKWLLVNPSFRDRVDPRAGGHFTQADFDESWYDVFGADAVDTLVVLKVIKGGY